MRIATALFCAASLVGALAFPALGRARREAGPIRAFRSVGRLPLSNPAYDGALYPFFFRASPLDLRVGVQVGHWRQDEMPAALERLRESTGASAGGVREVDVNLAIARELVALLTRGGIRAELLPATVPPGYLADAFVAIHADGAARPTARGWKIAAPWRASAASSALLQAVSRSYGELSGLPEDRYGVTYGMKGYYAFSPHRVRYAVSPLTPSIIVETGFVTVAADREVIVEQPRRVALAIATGLIRSFAHRPSPHTSAGRLAYLPPSYAPAVVAADQSVLRAFPGADEPRIKILERGITVLPMQIRGEWAEVVVRGDFRSFGWVLASELAPQPAVTSRPSPVAASSASAGTRE